MLQNVAEKRKQNRLSLNLKVFERETGKRLGLTENIHCEGMMLVCVRPFVNGEVIQLVIELPGKGETKKLTLTAASCWSVLDKKNAIYNVGFRFLYSTPEMKYYYRTLFDGLAQDSA